MESHGKNTTGRTSGVFYKTIGFKFLVVVGFFVFTFSLFTLYYSWSQNDAQMEELLQSQSELALQFNLAIREYVAESIRPFAQEYLDRDDFMPETMSTSFVARSVFEKVRKKFPDYIIKFSSNNPRNPANQASREELLVVDYFNKHPDLKTWSGQLVFDGRPHLAQFSARRMEESCLECHGVPSDAPKALIERYGDKAGFNRPLGEVIALDTVAIPIGKFKSAAITQTARNFLFLMIGLLALLAAIYYAFHRLVGHKLSNISKHFKNTADEDKDFFITPINYKSEDEIGNLAQCFNILAEKSNNVHDNLEKHVAERTKELEDLNSTLQHEIEVRKQQEAKNRQHHELLNSTIESLPHPFYVIDADNYQIIIANSATHSGEWTEDSTCYKLTHQKDEPCGSAEHPCPLEMVKRTGQPVVVKHIHYGKNGNAKNIEVHAYPVFDSSGKITQIIEYSFEIPESKNPEVQSQSQKACAEHTNNAHSGN
ncbi:MAG: DUF3365 domain-containing protein [Planctomycetes bacterium]|nr:DUF3365 domain-containing protein [Planctomycetota bacterium]